MFIRFAAASVLVGLGGWQGVQPERGTVDHTQVLRNPDGSWKYTNLLVHETSPYLLQHAHNPVDWHPWGEEAIRLAREEDKPIFLSVGYSTCYWCHVMERLVFSNPRIAEMMNSRFVNVKVDREERPDLDEIYMTATQVLTGSGGWPMSVFLTPDLKPFFAGTYFGPEDVLGGDGSIVSAGFPRLLSAISDAWANDRERVEAAADQLTSVVRAHLEPQRVPPNLPMSRASVETAIRRLAEAFDEAEGGFGLAPKFPGEINLVFLADVSRRSPDPARMAMVGRSLDGMIAGGIHDHVGGGFHRYSTDARWRVPHFEKMLYNQALMARAAADAFALTGEERYARAVRGIFRFVDEVMTGPQGQFYSALDAETDAVEGAYYVWTEEQLREVLGEAYSTFSAVFALAPIPRFPGHPHPDGGVLHRSSTVASAAERLDIDETDLRARIDEALARLKAVRDARLRPRLDDKVIVSWNGLMIDASARAGEALGDSELTAKGIRAAEFILSQMRTEDGRLVRIWRGGRASGPAFLEDYAMFIGGLLSLHAATGDDRWLEEAVSLAEVAQESFWVDDAAVYYFAPASEQVMIRSTHAGDGAMPSGSAVMVHNLIDLAERTGEAKWRDLAARALGAAMPAMMEHPLGYVHLVHALDRYLAAWPEEQRQEAAAGPAPEFPPDSGAHVRVSAAVTGDARVRAGDSFDLLVTLAIDPGWHVSANPASASFIIPTSIDVRSAIPLTLARVTYPEAALIEFPGGEQVATYAGEVGIVATVRLGADAPAGDATLRVVATFQACDDSRCLAPAQLIVEVPIAVLARTP